MREPTRGAAPPTTTPTTAPSAFAEACVDLASDAMSSQDPGGHVTGWNRSAERILGYAEHEVLGESFLDLFPAHLRGAAEALLARVAAGDRVEGLAVEMRRKDGMPVPVSLSMQPVRDGRTVLGSVAVARDVTEQRLAQAMLAETEARLREGEALAHVGRWLWDLGTGAVQWSDQLHEIHGLDPLAFGGTLDAHLACVHPDDRARVAAALRGAVARVRALDLECRIVRPDGAVRRLYVRAEPTVGSDGEVLGLRGIAQDVTDRSTG